MQEQKKLTCITCRILFDTHDEQLAHFKEDFHRFNLKRKMVELPPVTKDVFDSKVETLKSNSLPKQNETMDCQVCRKFFSSANTFKQHLESKRHKENLAKESSRKSEDTESESLKQKTEKPGSEGDDAENVEETEEEREKREDEELREKLKNAKELTLEDCLFCTNHFDSFQENLDHMTNFHGFFIPDIEYLKDIEGLIIYLGKKLSIGCVCLWCNDKRYFDSLYAVQNHMVDMGHCKLSYDGEDIYEYEDFYEFGENSIPDIDANIVDTNDFYLTLANGKIIGNRSLKTYYKQRPRPAESREIVLLNNVKKHYLALGWHDQGTKQSRMARKADTAKSLKHDKYYIDLGIRHNWLYRERSTNITARNSGR